MKREKINDTAGKDEKDAQRRIIRMVEAKLDDRSNHLINDENVFGNKVNEAFTLGLREGANEEKKSDEVRSDSSPSSSSPSLQMSRPSYSNAVGQEELPSTRAKLPDGMLDQVLGNHLVNPVTIYHGNEVLPLERQVNDGLSHRTAPLVIDSSHSAKQDLQGEQEQTPSLEELQDVS